MKNKTTTGKKKNNKKCVTYFEGNVTSNAITLANHFFDGKVKGDIVTCEKCGITATREFVTSLLETEARKESGKVIKKN